MLSMIIFIMVITSPIALSLIVDRAISGDWVWRYVRRSRATKPELYRWADCDYRTDPPQVLDHKYIDWLEQELEVGQYSPAAIELDRELAIDEGMEASKLVGGSPSREQWGKILEFAGGLSGDETASAIDGHGGSTRQQAKAKSLEYELDYRVCVLAQILYEQELEQKRNERRRRLYGEMSDDAAEFFGIGQKKPLHPRPPINPPVRTIIDSDGERTAIRSFGN